MYPMQCYPNQAQNPYLQPQVNAVKIDINNPQAYGGMNSQGQVNPVIPQQNGVYNYPCNPIYNVPAVQQYYTPNAYPQPVLAPIVQTTNANPAVNTPSTPATISTPSMPATVSVPQPVVIPPVPPVPAANVSSPIAPVIPAAPVVPANNVNQTVNVNPSIPAAVVDKKEDTTVAPVAPVNAQPVDVTGVDTKALLAGLSSTNADEQTAAIQKMAEIAQTDPASAKALLNEQTFGQLVNLINADTSKLKGPEGKSDPKNLSPLEKAEINKQFAVYTLAILQKNFRDEINKEMKKNNLPDIAINDLPYIKEGIVNNLKDNPNPTIREACLSALNYVGRPEDKDVLRTLYEISAKHDSNPAVKTAAQEYLNKLPA